MADSKIPSGSIQGHAWSAAENRKDLYQLARSLELSGLSSRSTKDEIVALLQRATKAESRAHARQSKAKTAKAPKPAAPSPKAALAAAESVPTATTPAAPKRAPNRPRRATRPSAAPASPNMPSGGARKVR